MRLPHLPVQRAVFQQLLLPPLGGDRAVFQNDDIVRVLYCGEAVGDDEHGLALCERGDAALDLVLILRVGERRRLVEDDDGRIL